MTKKSKKTKSKNYNKNNNSNKNIINIKIGTKTTRRKRKSKPTIKKVEGVSSVVPYYYKPPQNIITQPLNYNNKDNDTLKVHNNSFQTPEVKSTNLNSNSNNVDDDQNSTLSINNIGSIYGNDDDYNTVSKQLPHSASTHHLQDHYEIKDENYTGFNSFFATPQDNDETKDEKFTGSYPFIATPEDYNVQEQISQDNNFQDQQPQDYNFQDQQQVEVHDFKDEQEEKEPTHKELASKVNKENDEQLKALYKEYKELYKEVGADAYNIPKENLRTIRSREKFKIEIEKLKVLKNDIVNADEVKENELTASEKKTNEIKNIISSNKDKNNVKNKRNDESFKKLYETYKKEGGNDDPDDFYDFNKKTYDKKSINEVKDKIELLNKRKAVLKKNKKVPLINFLNECGVKYGINGNETIEELKQQIEELEI